jgi:hypothetical protein
MNIYRLHLFSPGTYDAQGKFLLLSGVCDCLGESPGVGIQDAYGAIARD